MKVEHKKSQAEPSLASKPGDKYYYRTEVTNTQNVPIRIVWFESYLMLDGEHWHGVNLTLFLRLRFYGFLDPQETLLLLAMRPDTIIGQKFLSTHRV